MLFFPLLTIDDKILLICLENSHLWHSIRLSRCTCYNSRQCHCSWGIQEFSSGDSAEAVSYETAPMMWLLLHLPFAPGASETVSVGPLSCLWMNSSSSTQTEKVSMWGVLSVWPNTALSQEKKIFCTGESLLFSQLTLKTKLAEVTEHQIPVFAQLIPWLFQYEPVVRIVENVNALFSHGNMATSMTFVKTRGDSNSQKGKTLYWYAACLHIGWRDRLFHVLRKTWPASAFTEVNWMPLNSETMQCGTKGTTDVPAVGQWGGTQGPGLGGLHGSPKHDLGI